MKRRDFCTSVALGGLALGASSLLGPLPLLAAPITGGRPDLVAVQGTDVAAALDKGLAELGGMPRFVSPGQTVLLKPNMGWAVTPEGGANTNPLLMQRLIKHCLDAGAKKVTCFDNTCDHWQDAYRMSGLERAVKDAGGIVAPAHAEGYFQAVDVNGGAFLKTIKLHELYLEADVIINVPVLKHHGGAGLSCALKNMMGVVWDRKFWHRNGLDQCIADFSLCGKIPALNVVDAQRVMLTGGPRGTSNSQFKRLDMLILSPSMVAADVASALAFGSRPEDFAYIGMAVAHGLGKSSLDGLDVRRVRA